MEGLDLDRLDTASQWIAAEQSNLIAFAEVAAGAPAAEVCSQAARALATPRSILALIGPNPR